MSLRAQSLPNYLFHKIPDKKKRTYTIGRCYLMEKEEKGGDRKSMRQNDALIEKDRTSKTIGDVNYSQLKSQSIDIN